MKVEAFRAGKTTVIRVNDAECAVDYGFLARSEKKRIAVEDALITPCGRLWLVEGERPEIQKELSLYEHLVGFGEKAFEIDRKRLVLTMWNHDPGGYRRGTDPIYASFPFFISIGENICGYFLNAACKSVFDNGMTHYDRIRISLEHNSYELYIFQGDSIGEILELLTDVTGRPFMPPYWSLGHMISRYSYFPQKKVEEIVREYSKIVPVSAVFLDIDYMDGFKIFTWDRERFNDPAGLTASLRSRNIATVPIVDPGVKAEQGYGVFERMMGHFVETSNRELFLGRVWPGLCAFPDFFNEHAQEAWKREMLDFISTSGLDGVGGIWLDMNEPSIFDTARTINNDAIHIRGKEKIKHSKLHNAYALFEAKATFEAMKKIIPEPFILTRAGYPGIQRFAAIWTGDNEGSWDDLRLQISMICSLGLSGMPFAGCDLGGFMGRAEPELIARYYQMAAFFPVYRNHKAKDGSDQELFLLPEKYREMAARAVRMRYAFLPYLYSLAYEAHRTGHPVVRPLCYEFPKDEGCHRIDDEYMVGSSLLYAPIIERGRQSRELYLPEGTWYSWWEAKSFEGNRYVKSNAEMPLFIRKNSIIPMEDNYFITYGNGSFTIVHHDPASPGSKRRQHRLTELTSKDHVFSAEGWPICNATILYLDAKGMKTIRGAEQWKETEKGLELKVRQLKRVEIS